MRALVRDLDHPEKAFKSVLIAGTNGKGSVTAYLDQALRSSPLRVGCYTSPHLIDVRERITVEGQRIGNTDLDRWILEVKDRSERLRRRGVIENHPSHFEILTLVAFLHFRARGVEVAVLEVGLGGRLDATNVASPLVSAIVSIDFDHEEYLGNTLFAIAREKAGVLRRNRTAILGPLPEEAQRSIVSVAQRVGARLVPAFEGVRLKTAARGLNVSTPAARYQGVRALPGAHQRSNLMVAIRILEALKSAGVQLDLLPAVAAMNHAVWPGRLERIEGRPPFLLDGAHNPAGARALASYLTENAGRFVLIFGAMRDKHILEMAEQLFTRARLVVATRVRMKRAAATSQLAAIGVDLGARVVQEPSIARAVSRAAREARPGEIVVVAGSLYLVGAVKRRLVSH